jgi:DNA primase
VLRDGLMARFLFLPDGEDPDTLVRSEGVESFSRRVNESLPFSEYFFKALSEDIDLTSMDGRARFSTEALPLIRTMQVSVLQQMMMDRVAEMTGLSIDQLDTIANLHAKVEQPSRPEPESMAPAPQRGYFESKPRRQERFEPIEQVRSGTRINLVNSAISILMHRPDLAAQAVKPEELDGVMLENIGLLKSLLHYFQNTPDASLGTLALDWQHDPDLMPNLLVLNEISQLDPVLSNVDAQVLLNDALQRLVGRKTEKQLRDLTQLSRERPLTSEEKIKLATLLAQRNTT